MIFSYVTKVLNNQCELDFSFEFFKIQICTLQRKENKRNFNQIFRLIFIKCEFIVK